MRLLVVAVESKLSIAKNTLYFLVAVKVMSYRWPNNHGMHPICDEHTTTHSVAPCIMYISTIQFEGADQLQRESGRYSCLRLSQHGCRLAWHQSHM